MALSDLVDLTQIYISNTGTGPMLLGGAVVGFQGAEALTDGNLYSYSIRTNGRGFEAGQGYYNAADNTLSRGPHVSSNGGALISIPQNSQVAITVLSADLRSIMDGQGAAAAAGAQAGEAAANAVVAQVRAEKAMASALGVSATAENMGNFAGTLLPADATAKQLFQVLADNQGGLIFRDAAAFFASSRVDTPQIGQRLTSQNGLAWDIVQPDTGDFNHPVTGVGVSVVPVDGSLNLSAFIGEHDAATDCTDAITLWCSRMQALGVGGRAMGSFGFRGPLTVDLRHRLLDVKAEFTTLNESDVGMDMNLLYARLSGDWRVVCGEGTATSAINYATYRQNTAIRAYNSARCTVESLRAFGAKRRGVAIVGNSGEGIAGNSNLSSFQFIQSQSCGVDNSFMDQAPTSITLTGSVGSSVQNTELVFQTVPETLDEYDVIRINGEPLLVTEIDRVARKVTCWPRLRDVTLSPARFIIGSGVSLEGVDANLVNIGTIDCTHGGTPLYFRAMFGASVGQIHGASHTYTLRIGRRHNASCHGLIVGGCYREAIGREVLEVANIPNGFYTVGYGTTVYAEVEKMVPVGLENGLTWAQKTRTQDLGHTGDVRHFRQSVGSPNNNFGYYHVHRTLPTQASAGYLLLTRNGEGAQRISGTLTGGRGVSSAGNHGFRLDFNIQVPSNAAAPSVTWNATSSVSTVRLCTVVVDGVQWVAVDLTTSGLANANLTFTGQAQDTFFDEVSFVATAQASSPGRITSGHSFMSGAAHISPSGPHADDSAAASAGVQIGEVYRRPSGTVVWRQA